MLPFKLITFDATGTLLLFKVPVLEKYIETGLKFGIKADIDVLQKNVKEAWKGLSEEHPNFGSSTGFGWENWWSRLVEETFKGYIDPGEKLKAAAVAEDLINFYSTKNGFTVRPGAEDLLKYLRTQSVQLGVISNYDPRLHQILNHLELNNYFNFILTSYEFGCAKPDAKIFNEALKLGKCRSGKEALHVGDDLQLDYKGAKDAGLNAIFVGETVSKFMVDNDENFKDFYSLKKHLQSLIEK